MATIDFSGAATEFDAAYAPHINHAQQLSYSSAHYSWKTNSNFVVTAHSAAGDITANTGGPLGGTISAINVIDDDGAPIFSITGLAVSLPSLLSTSDAATGHERFWETVLSGATTFVLPQGDGDADVFGDFVAVNAGQKLTGGNDEFLGAGQPNATHNAIGDAETVAAGATLTGGDDRFVDVPGFLVGDVGSGKFGASYGTVVGGKDSFVASSNALGQGYAYMAVGDVYENAFNVVGGADIFNFSNVAISQGIVGDVYSHLSGSVVGGDDRIAVAKTGAFHVALFASNVTGDVWQAGANAPIKGGNDVISLRDVTVPGGLAGDVLVSASSVTGGNDRIDVASAAPFFAGPPAVQPVLPYVAYTTGDAATVSAGTFVGGNDVINLTNAYAPTVVGDALSLQSGVTSGKGGNDAISVTWNQANIDVSAFQIAGDFNSTVAGSLTGGDDTITLDLVMSADRGCGLYGDAYDIKGTSFTGGNDTIVLNSNRFGEGNSFYGDARRIAVTGAFRGGNDRITGSNGADSIYGEALSVDAASYVGGNDVLDGRGGNDHIDGGLGFDTAVYSSLNQAVYINLNGIAGSAANPADRFEAIGQGSDQLIGIEAIIGSQLGDVVIGDAQANVFDGLGGNDQLFGGLGNDTLRGGAGNDRLEGGSDGDTIHGDAGADTMLGGMGGDVYFVDNAADVVKEVAGQGTDLVFASASYALQAGSAVELLSTANNFGTAAINLTGNAFANTLTGNAGANVLNGGGGADTMQGLAGNDTYVVDPGDKVSESGGSGVDTVVAAFSFNLGDTTRVAGSVENLTLTGAAINGTGNVLANRIVGNAAANMLSGGLGNDALSGGAGGDRLLGGTGLDSLAGGTGNDVLYGNAGNDRLHGGTGIDTLAGGAGNDVFVFDAAPGAANRDRVTDFANASGNNDAIWLENAIFTKLGGGAAHALNPALFRAGAAAADANDHLVYNKATGALFYDSNGSGAGGVIQIATLTSKPTLTAGDFMVV